MDNVIEHLGRFVGVSIDQREVFNPFGELVDHDKHPFETTGSCLEGADGVQSPSRKRPRYGYSL